MSLPAFGVGLVFLVLAVVTGLFGFGFVSDDAPFAAQLFSGFFLCSAIGAFWWSRMMRPPAPDDRRRGSKTTSRLASRAQ